MKKFAKAAVVGLALCAVHYEASAAVQLRLSDGTVAGTIVITDQDSNDQNPTVGAVSYNGAVGANWILNVSTGITKPVLGNALIPLLDLNTLNFSSQNEGTLTVELSETGFIPAGEATARIGGNALGSVTFRTWASAANTNFGKTTLLTSQGPFGPGAFDGTANGTVAVGTPYSVTLEAVIQHTGPGKTGFNAEFQVTPSNHGGCRVTGGSNHQTNSWQTPLLTTELPTHISHGGQVGAPFSVETPFSPNSPCIWGEWQHNRHLKGNSLVGVFHASGNGGKKEFDSLLCACLPCDEFPGATGVVGEVCNPGNRVCGPEPRRAPANKICFSGVGDYTFTSGNKTVKAVFRVDIEDRSEGNSQSSTPPPDRYRIRLWLLDPSLGRNPDPNSAEALNLRLVASADPAKIANLTTTEVLKFPGFPPDIDDGGNMTQGNHQIHPQTGAQCDAIAIFSAAHLDASTEIASLGAGGLSPFGLVAQGLQGTQNPVFVYRTTITNVGWVGISGLNVSSTTEAGSVDTTALYFAPGAVLPPGGTLTRYQTNSLGEDGFRSVSVSGVSVQDGAPVFSSSSATAVVGLAGPTGVVASGNTKKVTLTWNALSGATSYNLKRATVSGGPYATIKSGVTKATYTDNPLPANTTYYYVVSAVKSDGETLNSSEVSATTK